MVLHNQAVEHNVATFQSFPLLVHWQGRLSIYASTMCNSANIVQLLTPAVMVEKVNEYQGNCIYLLYGVAGCPLFMVF